MKLTEKLLDLLEALKYKKEDNSHGYDLTADFDVNLDKQDIQYLVDTLKKKYRNRRDVEVHFKAIKNGINAKALIINDGDMTGGQKSQILKEVEQDIESIINKWEKDNK